MHTKTFYVIAKSSNTNSFGLYQMVVAAEDGTAYKTCASMFNVKEEGQTILGHFTIDPKTGKESQHRFLSNELTERIADCPKEIVQKYVK